MVLLKKSFQASVATLASIPLSVNTFLLLMKQYSQTYIYIGLTVLLGTTQKWSPWTSGCLIKHLYKMTTNQMWSFFAGF